MSITLYINNTKIDYKTLIFKGGEVHVKLPAMGDQLFSSQPVSMVSIMAHLRSSNDIMELLLLTDAVRREVGSQFPIDVCIPYIPYARQDRVCDRGESLSINVLAALINSQNYRKVHVWDPHSDVSTALINNVVVFKQSHFLDKIRGKFDNEKTVLVSPDAGALKKIFEVATCLRLDNVIRADKIRDVKTGKISGTTIYGDVKDKECLIVDDLLDAGGTFMGLGSLLKQKGAKKVMLYITHGIFSDGVDKFVDIIDEIYCPNVWEDNVKYANNKGILRRDLG